MHRLQTCFLAAWLVAAAGPSPAQPARPAGSVTLAVSGDLIGPFHRIDRSADPAFADVAALFRGADAGFANAECAYFDLASFSGFPAAETGGGYPLQSPAIAGDLREMGISLASKANNHATDYGAEGLLSTLATLSRAGMVVGGAGPGEIAARAPAFLETAHGTVALVATASTFTPSSVAGGPVSRQGISSKPRPGISALHVRQVRVLPAASFEALKQAAGPFATKEGAALRIGDLLFAPGEAFADRWEMKPEDEQAVLASVDQARARADVVLFSIHAHETAGNDDEPPPVAFQPMVLHKANEAPSPDDPRPAAFEPELFHAAVDHGADIVVRHGPHVLGGIELYKGRPIFYGLGSLFLDFGGQRVLTTTGGEKVVIPDPWFDGVVPVCSFRAHAMTQCRLYPIAIETSPGPRSGVPTPAHGDRARAILERLQKLSAAFGTRVDIAGEVGLVQAPVTR